MGEMADEYKAQCGCKIHVAQWTAKRKVVTQESCPLHKAARELLRVLKVALESTCWDGDSCVDFDWHEDARKVIDEAERGKG
jgi:hypothetical protein